MDHLASLLKLLFEKSSWIAAGALLAAALALMRLFGVLTDMDAKTAHYIYLAGGFCFFVLVSGGAVGLGQWGVKKYKEKAARKQLIASAVKNLPSLPAEYNLALVWLAKKDMQDVSEDGVSSTLDTLAHQGYLTKEFPDEYQVIKTYRVNDEIWKVLKSLDLSKLKISEKRPWCSGSWRI